MVGRTSSDDTQPTSSTDDYFAGSDASVGDDEQPETTSRASDWHRYMSSEDGKKLGAKRSRMASPARAIQHFYRVWLPFNREA